jgi:propionyl-CoA synthetase
MDKLPKTRSGKILRGTIRKICNKEKWVMPATIDDANVLKDIQEGAEAWIASLKK